MQTRFNFIGETKFPKADSKRPFIKKSTNSDKKEMLTLNLGIKASDTNIAYVQMMDSVRNEIKFKVDGEEVIIKWENRFDEEEIKKVPFYNLYTVDLGEDNRHQFITGYDCIKFLQENLTECKICVTGDVRFSYYKGEYYKNFNARNFYVVDENKPNKLYITADIHFDKSCVDKSDWAENKVIYIDGYVPQYINKETGTKMMPQRFVFNASRIDPTVEKQKKLLDYMLEFVDVKHKTVHHLAYECTYYNGSVEVDFTEDCLTNLQKKQIELGRKTLEDFRPKGATYGEKVSEIRIVDPLFTGDFADGFVDTEMKMAEFEDEIFVPVIGADESLEDLTSKKTEESIDVANEDIFG